MNLDLKSICFYAHKGGVGKSFLSYEVATMLTKIGKTVYLIDADTQLNLTNTLLNRDPGIGLTDEIIEQLLTEKTYIKIGERHYKTLYGYLEQTNIQFNINDFFTAYGNSKLKYLIGSPLLSGLEGQLSASLIRNNEMHPMPALNNLKFLFRQLIAKISEHDPESIVIVDLSPGSNIMNQNILLSCDYLITTHTPDRNSVISLWLLLKYLPVWSNNHNYFTHKIKLLAGVSNRYKLAKHSVASADLIFIQEFERHLEAFVNQNNNMHVLGDIHTLRIQDGMAVIKLASESHVSIFEYHYPSHDTDKVEKIKLELINLLNLIRVKIVI